MKPDLVKTAGAGTMGQRPIVFPNRQAKPGMQRRTNGTAYAVPFIMFYFIYSGMV